MAPAKQGARIVHDDIVVFEVMTDTLDRPWWEAYRHRPRRQPAAGAKICLMRCVSMTMDAPTVVQMLKEFAARTSLRGGNPYRAKAYVRAAESLEALAVPLDQIIAEDRLTEIPGSVTR
jgi:Helix-hairpin-helix domain